MDKESVFKVAYYTGTGGTARVAQSLCKALTHAGLSGSVVDVSRDILRKENLSHTPHAPHTPFDILFLVFPVHAFAAPGDIYKWVDSLPAAHNTPSAVISVSGGGEVGPNKASRAKSIRKLEKKGFSVIYEDMISMPCNWVIPTHELLAVKMLEVLPRKTERIVTDILSGVRRRTRPSLANRFVSLLCELEKPSAILVGKTMKVSKDCNGCGICLKDCPSGNISLIDSKPHFSMRCHNCLNCIYVCPRKALMPRIGKFQVLKEGFSLKNLEKQIPLAEPVDIETLAKGVLWVGVREYLLENESADLL
jgi:ferredoxin